MCINIYLYWIIYKHWAANLVPLVSVMRLHVIVYEAVNIENIS